MDDKFYDKFTSVKYLLIHELILKRGKATLIFHLNSKREGEYKIGKEIINHLYD